MEKHEAPKLDKAEAQKVADGINEQSRALVRPFVMQNTHLSKEEFEPIARARLKSFVDYHQSVNGNDELQEIDDLWIAGIWRAMWHEWNLIRVKGGGGENSSIN